MVVRTWPSRGHSRIKVTDAASDAAGLAADSQPIHYRPVTLTRAVEGAGPASPVRLAHLGLGNFFRAHQAWYTFRAGTAGKDGNDGQWGYAAFTGRSPGLAEALTAQQGLYTLVTRAPDGDRYELVTSLSQVRAASDHEAWLACLRSPELAAITLTVTEAGYPRGPAGGLDTSRPEVAADIQALRADRAAPVRTVPGKLVAGLAARRLAGAGPVALIPCDNLPANGPLAWRVVSDLAERVDSELASWLADSVAVVSTVVDRITPRPARADLSAVRERTGRDDRCPVVTEPFSAWVLSGEFPAGRPAWEDAGAKFTADIRPAEDQKLWMLNGAHSLLAYAGSITGHATVPAAIADSACLTWLDEWWNEAGAHLPQPPAEITRYRDDLLARFANARMADRLDRIAEDGSQKLPVRVLPVLRAERQSGRLPAGAARVLAAWICHLRGLGAPVRDVRAAEVVPLAAGSLRSAVPGVLRWLGPEFADDRQLVDVVTGLCELFSRY